MTVLRKITLAAVVAAAALTATAVAQPPGGGRGGYGGGTGPAALLRSKTVLAELKVTDEQKEKLSAWGKEYAQKSREAMREKLKDIPQEEMREKLPVITAEMSKEAYKEIGTVLDEKQVKRLQQVEVQVAGLSAFAVPAHAEKLKITSDQKEKLKSIVEDAGKDRREIAEKYGVTRESPRPTDADKAKEYADELAKLTKGTFEKALAIMSDDQKKTYKELTGEPVDVTKITAETAGGGAAGRGKGKKKDD